MPGWLVLVGAMTAVGPFTIDMYLPGFPEIGRDLAEGGVERTMAAYLIGVTVGQLIYGPLSDRYGRRGPLLAGLALFAAASVAAVAAPSVDVLIAILFVQAFGGCAGIVIARAIVRDLFSGAEAAHFYALIMLVFGLAPILAPLSGGQFLALGGWRAPFISLAAFGAPCLAVVAWQVHGNIAEPIVCSRMAEIWALQSTNGGALTAPGQWVFPDEAAYIAYAREEYRKRSVKEQSAAD